MILRMPSAVRTERLNDPQVRAAAERLAACTARLVPLPLDIVLDRLLARPAHRIDEMIDDLASEVCATNYREPSIIRRKSHEEAGWVHFVTPLVDDFARGDMPLTELLARAGEIIFDTVRPFRRCAAGIVADTSGRRLVFPAPEVVPHMLQEVESTTRTLMADAPMLAAVVLMVGIVHCHPLEDGNGRLSRTLFAAFVRRASGSRADIPVLALECVSYPSYLVKTRRAQCLGDWEPITRHLAAALEQLSTIADPDAVPGGAS